MKTWAELLEYENGFYENGVYEKVYALSYITNVSSSQLSWTGDGIFTVKYKISGETWKTAINGQSLFDVGENLEDKYITIRIELTGDGSSTPHVLPVLSITQDEDILFYGIVGIPKSPKWQTIYTVQDYNLTLQSPNALLNRTVAVESYQNISLKDLVTDLFNSYISREGVTLGNISEFDIIYDVYTIKYKYLSDVLDEIAESVGGIWHIDNQLKFYFIKRVDMDVVDAPTHIKSISKKTSAIDNRNVQYIVGVKDKTDEQTETLTYNEDVPIVVNFNIYNQPTITINGTPASVGIKGSDDDDDTKTFLFTSGSSNISVNSNATIKPVNDDVLTIIYIGEYQLVVEKDNQNYIELLKSRTNTSGRVEKVSTDVEFDSINDADLYANGLLDNNGDIDEEISVSVDSLDNTELLKVWNFNLPTFNIVGEYVIVAREFGNFGICKKDVNLTLKNKNYWMKNGGIFNKYDKNIRRLSVGESDIVLKSSNINDIIKKTDEFRLSNLVYGDDGSHLEYLYDNYIVW